MKASGKLKLNLIDNYISIYRILYYCKKVLCEQKENLTNEQINIFFNLCDQTLDLKLKYEEAFKKLKMIDDSFLLLKQQLTTNSDIKNSHPKLTTTDISNYIDAIKNDYHKIKF